MNISFKNIFYYLSLALNIILPFVVFGMLDDNMLKIYYSSDTLYLASIYKDVFIDGTGFKGWNLNGAPNFFPDMFMYFIVRFFAGDFKIAYLIFSVIQYNLILFLLGSLLKGIYKKINIDYITFFNFLFPVFLLATIFRGSFQYTFDLFSQSYHNGCIINVLLTLNFFLRFIRTKQNKFLILASVFAFLGMYNDRLFLVMFTLPLLGVIIVNWIWIKSRLVTKSSIFIIASSMVGLILFNLTKNNSVFDCISLDGKFMNFSKTGLSFGVFFNQHIDFITSMDMRGLITIFTLLSFSYLSYLSIKRLFLWKKKEQHSDENVLEFLFILFAIISVFVTLATPVINGYYVGPACIRYTTFSLFLSVLNVVFILYLLNKEKVFKFSRYLSIAAGVFYLVIIIHSALKHDLKSNLSNVINYYPERVKIIDEFAAKHNLKYGMGGYWNAKLTTMFSKQDLRVYTAASHKMNLWYHVMNSNWYYDYNKGKYNEPVFNFIVSGAWNPHDVQKEFVKAIDSVMYNNEAFVMLVPEFKYNPETKQPYLLNSKQ